MKKDEDANRKIKMENLTNCMNCLKFLRCPEPFKENMVDCGHHFLEVPQKGQIVVVKLTEWSEGKKHDQ
jgi:hypothetical protein